MNRALRRKQAKEDQKDSIYRVDLNKIKSLFFFGLKLWAGALLLLCALLGYVHFRNNAHRDEVGVDPIAAFAKVTNKAVRKGSQVRYEFLVENGRFTGLSFYRFDTYVGAEVCVVYLRNNPKQNLLCHEKEKTPFFDLVRNVALVWLVVVIGTLVVGFGLFVFGYLGGSPAIRSSFMSPQTRRLIR